MKDAPESATILVDGVHVTYRPTVFETITHVPWAEAEKAWQR